MAAAPKCITQMHTWFMPIMALRSGRTKIGFSANDAVSISWLSIGGGEKREKLSPFSYSKIDPREIVDLTVQRKTTKFLEETIEYFRDFEQSRCLKIDIQLCQNNEFPDLLLKISQRR